jgi:uncharacterized cupin superfamily protein
MAYPIYFGIQTLFSSPTLVHFSILQSSIHIYIPPQILKLPLVNHFIIMPPSTPNDKGDRSAANTPYGHWNSFPWEDFPEYAGSKSVLYRSADGRVVAGAARETGTATLTYPCDEFFYVTEGWIKLAIHGGEKFTLTKGQFIYLNKGTTVSFEFGPDFANVAVFIDHDQKIDLI